jgi:ABC-2 type transport system permease protein
MVNTVMEIYLGVVQGFDLLWALLAQAAWAVIMVVICQVTLRLGLRRLVIQGG